MANNGLLNDSGVLNEVCGGAGAENGSYQLYYNGEALPMGATVAQMCNKYPEINIKDKLGAFYYLFATKTLNDLCEEYGQETIQGLINSNS